MLYMSRLGHEFELESTDSAASFTIAVDSSLRKDWSLIRELLCVPRVSQKNSGGLKQRHQTEYCSPNQTQDPALQNEAVWFDATSFVEEHEH